MISFDLGRRHLLHLAWVSVVGGCYQTGGPPTVEEFTHSYVTAFCQRGIDCCPPRDFRYWTVEECVADWEDEFWHFAFADSPGLGVYDPSAAQACLESIARQPCDEHRGMTEECRAVIIPQVALGASCHDDLQCVEGVCDGIGTEKTCVVPGVEGDACGDWMHTDPPCGPGLWCPDGVCIPVEWACWGT